MQADHPAHWESILAAGNERPPLTLRVNRRATTQDALAARFEAEGIAAALVGATRESSFASRVPLRSSRASRKARSRCRTPARSSRRRCSTPATACASSTRAPRPGGKTTHILELAAVDLTALDSDPARAGPGRGEPRAPAARRTRCPGDRGAMPAIRPRGGTGGHSTAILADVPCTASGIVRRHPDGKWLRRKSDLASFAAQQRRLITGLWPLLAPGGLLLYATCSVFAAENELQISEFTRITPEALRETISFPANIAQRAANSCLRGTPRATIRTASSTRCSARDGFPDPPGSQRRRTRPIRAGMPSFLSALFSVPLLALTLRRGCTRGHDRRSGPPSFASKKARCSSNADFDLAFNATLEEALQKGIPLYFVLEFELTRSRWYWLDEKVAQTVDHVARVVQRAHAAVPSSAAASSRRTSTRSRKSSATSGG